MPNMLSNKKKDYMETWCTRMNLILNRKKIQLMIVSKKTYAHNQTTLSSINLTQTLVHLSVQFDEKLDWRSHVEGVAMKAAQRIPH